MDRGTGKSKEREVNRRRVYTERFVSGWGDRRDYTLYTYRSSSMLRLIRGSVALARMLPPLDLIWSRNQRGRNGTGPGCVEHTQLRA